jgi:nucleoid-associated protein YgaU
MTDTTGAADAAGLGAWSRELRYHDHTVDEVFFGPRRPQVLVEDPAQPDTRIVAPEGLRLGLLAHEHYGRAELWWVIADASDLIDPFDIPPGTELRIPDLSRVQAEVLGR